MQIEPTAEQFAARYDAGEPQVVWTTLVADLKTPVSAFLKVANGKPMKAFCSSPSKAARCAAAIRSLVLNPTEIFRADGKRATSNRKPQLRATRTLTHRSTSRRLKPCVFSSARSRIALPDALPPMAAGSVRLSRLRHGPAGDGGHPAGAERGPDRDSGLQCWCGQRW